MLSTKVATLQNEKQELLDEKVEETQKLLTTISAFRSQLAEFENYREAEEIQDFTGRELEESGLSAIQEELKKYWYFNKQMRSAQGALRKKGDKFLDYVG